MLKSKFFKYSVVTFTFSLLAFSLAHRKVAAQSLVKISAIPPRLENLSADPGETITAQLKVRNEGESEMALTAKFYDFIVTDQKGTPTFLLNESLKSENRWALSNWLSISPTKFVIKPGETKALDLIVIVPEDALPGGHYAAVAYESTDQGESEGSSSQIVPSVATLVYLNVNGDITEDALVRKIDVPKFSEYGPININTEITNLSDTHIKPLGAIKIYNLFNRPSTVLNLEELNIFPNGSRIYENTWNKKWLFGRFKAELSAVYGTQGQLLTAFVYFWVIPWKLILACLLLIGLTVLIVTYLRKKKRIEILNS